MSVSLVFMPFGALQHPSLAIGLLSAALRRDGIPVECVYGNLMFAERIGVDDYQQAGESTRSEMLLGEWIFSEAAFGRLDGDFLDWLKTRYCKPHHAAIFPAAQRAQAQVQAFIDELAERVVAGRPKIVGASSSFLQNCASLALLKRIKQLDPSVVTIMGGANCEGAMGLALVRNFPWLDYAASGEADQMFSLFCQDVLQGGKVRSRVGLLHRSTLVTAGSSVERATVNDLNALPVPDYTDYFRTLDRMEYAPRVDPGLVMESSRGCWWGAKHHCTFCGLNGGGMGYRIKSSERVLEEFETLSGRYGIDRFEIADNILDMGHLRTVLPQLAAQGAPYGIFYETKSNLKRAQVELLVKAGVRWIQPGIESLHDQVLKLMDKGSSALMNVRLLRNAREFGMRVSWNFLSGFPGENSEWSESMAGWLPLIFHLQPPSGNSRVRYDRFSPYHNDPDRYDIEMRPCDAYARVYPLDSKELFELAYFFDDADPAVRQLQETGYRLLKEQVSVWQGRWSGVPPMLACQGLDVFDTRRGKPKTYLLSSQEKEFLVRCESPHSISLDDSVVQSLVEKELLLVLDGKALSLLVEGEVPELPSLLEFPGGNLIAKPWSRRYRGFEEQRLVPS